MISHERCLNRATMSKGSRVLALFVALMWAAFGMPTLDAQKLSIRRQGSGAAITIPGVIGNSLAPSVDIPGMPTTLNGGFTPPEVMVNKPVPGHMQGGQMFAPVSLASGATASGDGTDSSTTANRGWGTIVWPQGEEALEWLTEKGQEWRDRSSVIAAWKYQRDLSGSARATYAYYQSLAAQYVEFQAGPAQKTLPPFFDYTRFASYENKQSAREDELASFVTDDGSKLVVTLVNKSPFDLCVSYLTPSSEKIADRVSVTNPIHIAPNGVPTMISLRTLPGVLTAQDARVVFGIGNCADMESRHEQLRLVGFKVGPSSVDPEEAGEEAGEEVELQDNSGGGGCPPGTHMEPVRYREGQVEEVPRAEDDFSSPQRFRNKENAWSEKARPFMCIPDHRWDVLTADGVKDVCEYWFGDRAAITRHNTEEHPSGIEWEAQPYDIFDTMNTLVASVKNPGVCKCKEGWSPLGATADEVCRPACLNQPHTELAHRGGTYSDPVCRCVAGYYFSSKHGCQPETVPTPCPKSGAGNGTDGLSNEGPEPVMMIESSHIPGPSEDRPRG
jgi:hypothetical protein